MVFKTSNGSRIIDSNMTTDIINKPNGKQALVFQLGTGTCGVEVEHPSRMLNALDVLIWRLKNHKSRHSKILNEDMLNQMYSNGIQLISQ